MHGGGEGAGTKAKYRNGKLDALQLRHTVGVERPRFPEQYSFHAGRNLTVVRECRKSHA